MPGWKEQCFSLVIHSLISKSADVGHIDSRQSGASEMPFEFDSRRHPLEL